MKQDNSNLHYATGEVVCIGDRVVDDVWPAIVREVILSADSMAQWGVQEAGVMLETVDVGWVFEPLSSHAWDAIMLQERGPAKSDA